jgi:outer membrane protein assembly factor BamA
MKQASLCSYLAFLLLLILFTGASALFGQHIIAAPDSCTSLDISEKLVVGDIRLIGNKVTRDKIILRELELTSGDTLALSDFCRLVKQSRLNLLNRSIFNFVTVDSIRDGANQRLMHLEFQFVERWYFWPFPIFELADRNFNAWFNTGKYDRVNYGMLMTHNNFRGRIEQFRILIRAGFNQNFSVRYDMPYLTRDQTFGLGFLAGLSRNPEAAIANVDDKQLFFKPASGFARENLYGGMVFSYRPAIRNTHSLMVTLDYLKVADSVILLNPDYSVNDDSELYNLAFSYTFKHDFRDHKPYPLSGYYFDTELSYRKLFTEFEYPDFFVLKASFDFYEALTNRLYWASNLTARFTDKSRQPYFLSTSFGFNNDFVRSYELYVIEGYNWGIMKNNLKYQLLKPQISRLPWIQSEKFNKIHYAIYLNLFADFGYVRQNPDRINSGLQNQLLHGFGLGMDFVTYYDLVFRFEYGINHLHEKGLFIHFVAPI